MMSNEILVHIGNDPLFVVVHGDIKSMNLINGMLPPLLQEKESVKFCCCAAAVATAIA